MKRMSNVATNERLELTHLTGCSVLWHPRVPSHLSFSHTRAPLSVSVQALCLTFKKEVRKISTNQMCLTTFRAEVCGSGTLQSRSVPPPFHAHQSCFSLLSQRPHIQNPYYQCNIQTFWLQFLRKKKKKPEPSNNCRRKPFLGGCESRVALLFTVKDLVRKALF